MNSERIIYTFGDHYYIIMETKKILKKQKKAEQKLKDRQAKAERQAVDDVIVVESEGDEEVNAPS
jgi:hypothetical protein